MLLVTDVLPILMIIPCQFQFPRFIERKYTSSSLSNHNHLDKRTSTEKVLSSLATQAARAAINESEELPQQCSIAQVRHLLSVIV